MKKYQVYEGRYGHYFVEDVQGNFLKIDDMALGLSEEDAKKITAILNKEQEADGDPQQ